MINIIAAVSRNRAIGNDNKLIYWLPDDMRRFRMLTTGHTIIMGRRTYESLPNGALPNRRNIVLTRTTRQIPGCDCFTSLEEALLHCTPDEDIYIIGGASVYRKALPIANRLFLTEVDDTPKNANTFFPPYDDWTLIEREEHPADIRHPFPFVFATYTKSKSTEM